MHCAFSLTIITLLGAALMPPVLSSPSHGVLDVSIVKAPVAPDGNTAGAVTDIVLTFVNRNPSVDGIGIKENGTIEVVLPEGFVNTGAGGDVVVILQGWPQSPLVPFPYLTSIVGNTITLTMTQDWMPSVAGPGPKQVHLILFGFENPGPGRYPVTLTIHPDPNLNETHSGVGFVQIIPRSRPSINTVSLFSGPPGPPPPFFNPIYQTVVQGEAARQVGFYLWDKDSEPFVGVDLEMTNRGHGLLFDVDGGQTVGHVWIQAPPGAVDFALDTAGPSTETLAFVTGVPVGLLLAQFWPDPSVAGDYVITLSTNNGNEQTLFVSVVPE